MSAPTIHATALIVADTGLLVRGASGAGKSTLARLLIAEARRRGLFARLVADDRTCVSACNGRLLATVPERIAGLVEARGHGIIAVPHEPAAVIGLVVDIVAEEALDRLPEQPSQSAGICGIRLPRQAVAGDFAAAVDLVFHALSGLGSTGTR